MNTPKAFDIKEKRFSVIIRANSNENKIERFDATRGAYIVSIKAKPIDNKANIELIKFLSKELKANVRLVSGLKSRKKIIEIMG